MPKAKDTRKFHDNGYRQLFSYPSMVENLVRSFVSLDLVEQIDFSTLRRINATYVTPDRQRRESDLIWVVQTGSGPAYLYFLIEFQSKPDRFMAVRLLHYLMLFYLGLIREGRVKSGQAFRLPPVLPIVLYRGSPRWTAPRQVRDLIEVSAGDLAAFVPSFSYYLIAENEIPVETLQAVNNLVAKLFMLEHGTPGEVPETLAAIASLFPSLAEPELERDFTNWVQDSFWRSGVKVDTSSLEETEVRIMLWDRIKAGQNRAKRKGRQEGRQEGRREGELNGELKAARETLTAALRKRLPDLDDAVVKRIGVISDVARLQELTLALLDSPDCSATVNELMKIGSPQRAS